MAFALEFNEVTPFKILVLSARYDQLEWTANSTLSRILNCQISSWQQRVQLKFLVPRHVNYFHQGF